jgi:hypothetical protein
MYSLVAPCELLTVTSGDGPSYIFYTDGSLIEGYVGFSVGIAELSDLFAALRH